MNRREFCHKLTIVGGAVALAPIMNACGRSQSTPPANELENKPPIVSTRPSTPLPTAEKLNQSTTDVPETVGDSQPPPSREPQPTNTSEVSAAAGALVAIVRTENRSEGVKRAIKLLGLNPIQGNRVLLKPNFNSADEAPGSTHSDVLRAMVYQLQEMGARGITVADRSGMGDTRSVLEQKGVMHMAAEYGFDTLIFDELEDEDWVISHSSDHYWSKGFAVPRQLLDSECVVQTCNLKTHRYGGHFTLSLKNSVGFAAKTIGNGYDYMRELHNSPYQRSMIADINTAYTPDLIVMDGVEAFVNGGPAKGKKVQSNVVLAATDRVALDAVGVAILRMFGTTKEVSLGKVFEQEQIARAVDLGLGVDGPEKIQFLAADAESQAFANEIGQMLTM
jgi:uncharacterized protein (DUF362 family)